MRTTWKPTFLWDFSVNGEVRNPFIHLQRSNMNHWPLWKDYKGSIFELLDIFAEQFHFLLHNGFEVNARVVLML